MPRTHYALPVDVVRRFNPQLTQENLENWETNPDAALIGHEDVDKVTARIEGVESKWDREATPMRPVRIGSTDAPIYQSAKGRGFPVHVYLDHRNIRPIDPAAGDVIERRTGRDNWTDITTREGQAWTADYRQGVLTVYALPGAGQLPALRRHRDRFVRLSYRLGAGGDYASPGQTTLTAALASGDTSTVGVDDASRLPPEGGVFLLGGEEYVEVASVDHTADEISVATRGVRASSDVEHSSGGTVHYCPMNVREAVAAKTAQELVQYDDWTEDIVDGGRAIQSERKLDDWEAEWSNAIQAYSGNYGYQ